MSRSTDGIEPFFDSLTERTGTDGVLGYLPYSESPLVGWAVFWVGAAVLLQGYKIVAGYSHTYLSNPLMVTGEGLILLAAIASVSLRDQYSTVLHQIDIKNRTDSPERFYTIIGTKSMALIYVLAIGYTFLTFFVLKGTGTLMQIGGVAEVILAAIVAPIGYATVSAEFVGTYIGIMLLLPRRIKQGDFQLHFLDPEGLGGLRPVGELMKKAYYFVVLGLVGWLVIVYGPFVMGKISETPLSPPGFVINLAFTSAWLLSIGTMAYGLSQVHSYMKTEKRTELTQLDRRARELIENPFDLQEYDITDEERYNELRDRMDYVNATKEYPTTFTMWSQILLSLVLPKAVQMVLASV